MQILLRHSERQTRLENNRILLGWGMGALLAVVLCLGAALLKISADRARLIEQARSEVIARANSYAEQVLRTVFQIDQLSMAIKYQWENKSITLNLEDQYRKGVYQGALYPVAINVHGYAIFSTRRLPKGTYMGDLDFFTRHRHNPDIGLTIAHPADGRGGFNGKKIIRFSRAFITDEGKFDGVVLIATEPDYIASFHDESRLLVGDFISVYFNDGSLMAGQSGGGSGTSFFRNPSKFETVTGSRIDPGEMFSDNRSRLIGWKKLQGYPLVTIAAISQDNALAPYASTQSSYLTIASLFSLLIALFAAGGAHTQIKNIARRRHELQVQSTFRLAVDGAREAFYMIEPTYHPNGNISQLLIEDCNERAAEISGYPRSKLIKKSFTDIYHGQKLLDLKLFFYKVLEEGFNEDDFYVEHGMRHVPGWFQRRAVRSGTGVAVTVRDVSEAKQQAKTLAAMARTDSLTGLPNRHWLNDYLPAALDEARQHHHSLALYYVDLDNFKDINDALGHKSGDEVLCAVANSLRLALRAGDHLVRIGGDEFLAVIENLEKISDATQIAEKLINAISLPSTVAEWRGFVPKASIGISLFPGDGQDMESLLQSADIAMYQAKSEGRSCFRYYNDGFAQKIRDRISTERSLEQAILLDEFIVYYQPRADAQNGSFSSMEALVRWSHPQRGLIAPAEFIPVAERSRLIIPLGDLVIRKVCEQMMDWRDQGVVLKPVSINVSALQLRGDGLRLSLAANLSRYALPSALIAIELTESSMLDETGDAFEELKRLREMGFELQIDDFGTGYSSLSKLQSLDIDVVKIDQSFIYKLETDQQSRALCETIVSIGRSLNISVVAEGVETSEQLEILRNMGCDEIQGYLISRPVPAEQIPALINKNFF